MRAIIAIFAALVLAVSTGCQTRAPPTGSTPASMDASAEEIISAYGTHTIYVVSNGWHTAIVLARSDVSVGVIPETADFPQAMYFEFSWGDAEYFPAPSKTMGMAMSALLTPTSAVLHLAGLPAHPQQVFSDAETIEIEIDSARLRDLVAYLNQTFARGNVGGSIKGLYPFSRFYAARGKFHLLNTCNTWTARGLAAAGVPLTVTGTLRAEDLMAQLRNSGEARN